MFCWTLHLKGSHGRTFATAVPVGHKLYSFGGYSKMNDRDQIHVSVFNTVSLRCMKLAPLTAGRGQLTFEVPANRVCHTAVLINRIVYIWGGVVDFKIKKYDGRKTVVDSQIGQYCNVLYAFDVDTHRWFEPKISGTVPGGRKKHSACVLGKVMYIHGGRNKYMVGLSNDIYKLDTATMVWSFIKTGGIFVSRGHSATIIGTKMFEFGGDTWMAYANNISVFDTETNRWRWLNTPAAQSRPGPRRSHSAFAYNGELYIFGGHDKNQVYFCDMWKFNTKTFSWRKVEPKGKFPSSCKARKCCMMGDRIIVFGGFNLHILDFSPSMKTLCKLAVIQYGLERSGLPHNIKWEMAAMTT